MKKRILLLLILLAAGLAAWQTAGIFPTLKSTVLSGRQPEGFYLLPTSQLLRPWGEQMPIAGRPVDIALDPPGRMLAVLNTRSIALFDAESGARLGEVRSNSTSYAGVAFRPGTHEVWASETTRRSGSLLVAEIGDSGNAGSPDRMNLEGHPVPAGMAFNRDGSRLFVALSRKNSLGVIDPAQRKLIREVPVGMAPFSVAVCEKCGKVFVSNRGGRRPDPGETTAPSSGSAILTDPITGSTSSGTVSVVDLKNFSVREVPVKLAPAGLALTADGSTLAVANSHSDSVTFIDTASWNTTELKIPSWPEGSVGSQPTAVAFAADGKRLYVACGGTNAIVVASRSRKSWVIEGAVPTGWFPSAFVLDSKGALRIVNIKGVGNTANGKGGFNSRQFEGSLTRIPPPATAQLAAGTREVAAANKPQFDAAGGVSDIGSLGIVHVLFIIKENRTYDQVFGDIGRGNSDPKLCMYPRDITPNHHALADQYVLLDNFYTGGAISFDGHQWLMQAFVSDYVERAFAASPRGYAWQMGDALTVAPTGFFWQAAPKPLNVRSYGEFCLPAQWDPSTQSAIDMNEDQMLTWSDYWRLYKEGKWQTAVGCRTGVPALQNIVSQRFPTGTQVTDQIRADIFIEELGKFEETGTLPNLTILTLSADHTNGTRPTSATPRAMVADNDLALGRIMEAISKSKFWPKTLVLIVEDDAQDGVDHVDGRRTIALAAGPHIKRNSLDSNYYDHQSMVRTIQAIFGIPAKTRYGKSARPMTSIFQAEGAAAPFQALVPKVALDEMNPPLKTLAGRRLWAAKQSLAMNFTDVDDVPKDVLNRILWWDAKGYDVPFPSRASIFNDAHKSHRSQ
jgi:YVTN family beta-propeller protein